MKNLSQSRNARTIANILIGEFDLKWPGGIDNVGIRFHCSPRGYHKVNKLWMWDLCSIDGSSHPIVGSHSPVTQLIKYGFAMCTETLGDPVNHLVLLSEIPEEFLKCNNTNNYQFFRIFN